MPFPSIKNLDLKAPSLPSVPKIPSPPSLPSFSPPHLPSFSPPHLPSLPSPPLSVPSLHSLPSVDSITSAVSDARAKVVRSMSKFSDHDDDEEEGPEKPVPEPVYIVLRPLHLMEAPQAYLRRLGRVVKAMEFEHFLMLQHWGVLIGERYYHLHINEETQKISVSMLPFVDVVKHESLTIKFPIWRTILKHDERVGVAVGIIKTMGNFDSESDVEIVDEHGNLVTSPEERARYTMEGRYVRTPLTTSLIPRGKYSALANNCIHFTRHFVFDQILTKKRELKNFVSNVQWVVTKWRDMGCRRGPAELTRFLSGLLGIGNPFAMGPQKGARLLIKLCSIFLDIEYNPVLDKKLLDDSANAHEALDEVSDDPLEEDGDKPEKTASYLPIPQILPGEEAEDLQEKMGEHAVSKE